MSNGNKKLKATTAKVCNIERLTFNINIKNDTERKLKKTYEIHLICFTPNKCIKKCFKSVEIIHFKI